MPSLEDDCGDCGKRGYYQHFSYNVFFSGFTNAQWDKLILEQSRVARWEQEPLPCPIPLKEFKPAYANLPILSSYEGDLGSGYWDKWEKKSYESLSPVRSWICPEKLASEAAKVGFRRDNTRLERVLGRLRNGANIGCTGAGRLPTRCPNAPGATEFGPRVADSLQGWIVDGLCFGPLTEEELPWKDFTVNPITMKLKPNGKARICINM